MDIDEFQLELGQTTEISLALILAIMMFAVALDLRTEQFKFFKERPKIYLAGVIGQLIGLPLITLGLCYILNPLPSVALGMILISCCPGGTTSNLMSLYARANTALSVSLTATSSLFAAFLTPISILFWCSLYPPTRNIFTEINLNVGSFLSQTFIILALPLILGMVIAHKFPRSATKLQTPLAAIGGLGLLAIIVIGVLKYFDVVLSLGLSLFGIVILHNALAFSIGWTAGRIVKADIKSRRALTIEVGIQNSGLGIVILLTQLGGLGGAGAIAGLWGTWHIVAGLTLVAFYNWRDRQYA